jgi:hypothetical protein
MAETRDFHIGDILTITTERLVSLRHMEGVYDILNWMAGESVYTHQIPRIMGEAAPVLLAAHPQLAAVDDKAEIGPDTVAAWVAEQAARFGETLPVPRLNADQHERIDPLSELAERVHPDRIVVVGSR